MRKKYLPYLLIALFIIIMIISYTLFIRHAVDIRNNSDIKEDKLRLIIPVKSSDYDAANDYAVDLIFVTNASSSDWHGKAMKEFAYAVEELSDGSITCSVYPNSSLLTSDKEWEALSMGHHKGGVDIAYVSFQTLSTQPSLEWCEMIGSAYFWTDFDHMNETLNGEIGHEIFDRISENTQIIPINAMYLGSRVINTKNKAIHSYEDMDGVKLRMPSSEAWMNLGRALNADPIALPFTSIYQSLQTDEIDGQDNPIPTDVVNGFYMVAPYFAITNHVVDSILPCINKDTWESLTEAQRLAVKDAFDYAKEWNNYYRLQEEKSNIDTLINECNCVITYPSIDEFKEHAKEWYDAHPEVRENWDMSLYYRIQKNHEH